MLLILIVLGAIFLIVAFSGAYVFLVACVRNKELPWLDKEKIRKTPYGRFYDDIVHAHEWLESHNARDICIESYDGLKLHGRWIPADDAKGTILFAHGYRSTYLVDFGLALDFYHDEGMNILLPDQRSHGKSEGRIITFGVKESRDMLSWLMYLNKKLSELPVVLSGMSMGASTMMYLADEDLPPNVKGFIVDCGFTTPKEILGNVFTSVTHLPSCLCMWSAAVCAKVFGGFGLSQKDSRVTLAKNKLPIIMVHGTDDSFVPCQMSKDAYACCTGPKQLLLIDGAEHGMSFLTERERYTSAVKDFLREYIY